MESKSGTHQRVSGYTGIYRHTGGKVVHHQWWGTKGVCFLIFTPCHQKFYALIALEKKRCGVIIAGYMAGISGNHTSAIYAQNAVPMLDATRTQENHLAHSPTRNCEGYGWRHMHYLIQCGNPEKWQENKHIRCFPIISGMRSTLADQTRTNAKKSFISYQITNDNQYSTERPVCFCG